MKFSERKPISILLQIICRANIAKAAGRILWSHTKTTDSKLILALKQAGNAVTVINITEGTLEGTAKTESE
ncbi:hypothetical protein GC194_10805 [bacterium]|nr:hypothetical protein [bacterium]